MKKRGNKKKTKETSKNSNKELKKYLLWAIVGFLIVLSFFIIRPFLIPLISAFILAYLVKPIYNKLNKKIPSPIAAAICILIIILIVILPLAAITTEVINQTSNLIKDGTLSELLTKISQSEIIQKANLNLNDLAEQTLTFMTGLFLSAINYLPTIIISLIIVIFGMYYILVKWETITNELKKYLPFKDKNKISKEISEATNQIIYGTILIAIIEFILALAGFYAAGVKFYLIASVLIFFFAFIPGLGPTIIWVPMAIYYLITKNYFTFAGIIITGIILSSLIDMLLRSKIIGNKTKMNPLIMLIGILGGIALFGIFGFILGPLILIYTIKLIQSIIESK